jgi:TolB-like protein/DNA-binding winged helix-turn-helix (wHTH) protein/Tfp pilus assembly protein PilF
VDATSSEDNVALQITDAVGVKDKCFVIPALSMKVIEPMKELWERCRFGSFELDPASGELRKAGIRIKLEDQPFRLLAMLAAHPGEVLNREELRAALWPDDTYVEFDGSLTRAINKVRTALGDTAANPRFVETLPRRGYRFVAPVSLMPATETSLPPGEGEAGRPEPPPRIRAAWKTAIVVGVLVVLVGAAATLLSRQSGPPRISAVAVLPFENVSGDPGQNYYADGITDQLITALSRIRSLQIVSRTSAMHYKGTRRLLPDIAAELNVHTIVEGSVALSGARVRLNIRIIRLPGERAVWTRSYEREATDALALQVELAGNIADEMGAFITPAEQKRLAEVAHPVNAELHSLYLQGRLFVNEPDRDSIERGLHALEQVIAKDPANAPAWAAISNGWFSLSSIYLPPAEAMPKARAAARKALDLDPELDAAHAALGLVHVFYDWDWPAAEEQFRKALDINANSSAAYRGLGFLMAATGRNREATQAIQRAIELDPMSLWAHFQSVLGNTSAGKHEEAERQARRVLGWEPRFGIMRSALGLNLAERGKFSEAIQELEKAVESQKVPTTMAWLAQGYATAGRTGDAERAITDLVALAKTQYVCPFEVASAFTVLGRKEEAFTWMNKGVVDRADCMIWLGTEPWLDPLRRDPRYTTLVRQVGLP